MRAGFEQLIFVEFCHFQSSVLKQQGMKQMLNDYMFFFFYFKLGKHIFNSLTCQF